MAEGDIPEDDRSHLDRSAFHRTGVTSPWGKLDDRVEAVFRIESLIRAEFLRKAALAGRNETELMRDIYRLVAMGPEEIKRVHGEQTDRVWKMLGGGRA